MWANARLLPCLSGLAWWASVSVIPSQTTVSWTCFTKFVIWLLVSNQPWYHIIKQLFSLSLVLTCTVQDENTYILTTDADVRFTHESVEALLDLMARDPTVGAVCARTHPLGVGPLVWYQVFDYAIGHWFQKVHDFTRMQSHFLSYESSENITIFFNEAK